MKHYLVSLLLGLTTLLAHAQDDAAVDALIRSLEPVGQLQGNFTQRQFGPDQALVAQSSGKFRLLRPGYFYWEILSPDSQLVVAGPQYVWHYDRDLETVTRRPVHSGADMTPLQILGGDDAALRENFDVTREGDHAFVLTPRSSDVGFKQLTLQLSGESLSGMKVIDNLEQRIEIVFSDLDATGQLSASDFDFAPPEGVDLFYYDE